MSPVGHASLENRHQQRNRKEAQKIQERLKQMQVPKSAEPSSEKKRNPFEDYFGFDVRKTRYSYKKYETQTNMVRSNLRLEKDIKELTEACATAQESIDMGSLFPCNPIHDGKKLVFGGTLGKQYKSVWDVQEHDDIWSATRLGVLGAVEKMLQNGKSPDARTVNGETPYVTTLGSSCFQSITNSSFVFRMHLLACIGDTDDHIKIAQLLLQYGSKSSVQTMDGYTPIMYAAISPPHADIILQMLLESEHDSKALNRQNKYGSTALHLMIKTRNVHRLKLMLSYKPNLNLQDNEGNSKYKNTLHTQCAGSNINFRSSQNDWSSCADVCHQNRVCNCCSHADARWCQPRHYQYIQRDCLRFCVQPGHGER